MEKLAENCEEGDLFVFLVIYFQCMRAYIEFEILEGAYEISCPDAMCPAQGVVTMNEIAELTSTDLMTKHNRYRLNRGRYL